MLFRFDNGLKVKVNQGVEVNLKGIKVGIDNPHKVEVHPNETYYLYYTKLYKDGIVPLEKVIEVTSECEADLEREYGYNVTVKNSNTVKLVAKDGTELECTIVPNNIKGVIEEELSNYDTVELFLTKDGIGSNSDDPDVGNINDIEACYSVFKECFELVD